MISKGKVNTVQAWTGHEGSRRLSILGIVTIGT